jgi:hypothetical protein
MKFLTGLLLGLGLCISAEAGSIKRTNEIIKYPTVYAEATVPTKIDDELYIQREDDELNYTSE